MQVRRPVALACVAVILAAGGFLAWRVYLRSDKTIIRERLDALASEINEGTTEGLGLVGRAARIGSYFTPDVVVDLGEGSGPIRGRETLMGMAARLQPRTSAFTLAFKDVTVNLTGSNDADVDLTATFTRRDGSGDESLDAREFDVAMKKVGGDWLVDRATEVEPLNKR